MWIAALIIGGMCGFVLGLMLAGVCQAASERNSYRYNGERHVDPEKWGRPL